MKTSTASVSRRRLPVILGGAIAIALIVSSLVIAQRINPTTSADAAPGEKTSAANTTNRPAAPAATKSKSDRAVDEAAVRKSIRSYIDAFNRGDAKAIAALWSPEGVYVMEATGEEIVGRPALEASYVEEFASRGKTGLEVDTQSIEFLSPNVAVERGTSRLIDEGKEPVETNYSALYVKRDGFWLLDRVVEEVAVEFPAATSQSKIQDLDWMVGNWSNRGGEVTIESQCRRTLDGNFLSRSFAANIPGQPMKAGIELIGYDPAAKCFRSWIFDSNGGFAESVWTREGDRWFVRQTGVLDDGQTTSATNILFKLSDNEFTWQSVNREAGGKVLPNTPEMSVVRVKAAE